MVSQHGGRVRFGVRGGLAQLKKGPPRAGGWGETWLEPEALLGLRE